VNRDGNISQSQRNPMMLSQQTLNGLHITCTAVSNFVKDIMDIVFTLCFNQDQLEPHYRNKGGNNSNPAVFEVNRALISKNGT